MITAVIPAYNEELTIEGVVDKTKKYVDEIIVINDASTDETKDLIKEKNVKLIDHKKNRGLGKSLRDGIKKAIELDSDIIITIDADGQHDPDDIPRLVEKIKNGNDFVLGARDLRQYPFIKKLGNFFLNTITNFISGTYLKDTESGFRAFTKKAAQKMTLKSNRYEIATEIIFEVGKNNLKSTNIKIDSPIYVKGVGIGDGILNFIFLINRSREKKIREYLRDIKYVLKKWF